MMAFSLLNPDAVVDTQIDHFRLVTARICAWLLSSRVQMRDGPHAGGVAGAFNVGGQALYIYPEITGYYMQWLAELCEDNDVDGATRVFARAAATRSAEWTSRQFEHGAIPETRSHLIDNGPDWRNDACFFFDLAMLVRGLCAANEAGLIALPGATLQRLMNELERFINANRQICATRKLHTGTKLPDRWSTHVGPFLLKATSRVMLAARHMIVPERLAAACEQHTLHYAQSWAEIAVDLLHPTLYFIEGMLVAQPQCSAQITSLLQRCLRLQRDDGSLPESEHGAHVPRNDILAQALRIGLLLRANRIEGAPDAATLHRIAAALLQSVAADGSVPFRSDSIDTQPNVWCALFAEQALRWYTRWCCGATLPSAQWLV